MTENIISNSSTGAVFGEYLARKARRMAVYGQLCWLWRNEECDNERSRIFVVLAAAEQGVSLKAPSWHRVINQSTKYVLMR